MHPLSGLFHDFLLLSIADAPFTSYSNFIHDPRSVRLHDDFISYLWDSLTWIPSYNPAMGEPVNGLCRWGVTIISIDGASIARRVFTAWADLFDAGPRTLRLTGVWTWTEGEPCNEGEFSRLEFERKETVKRLRILARYADEVASSGHDLYILHLGI